MNDKSWIGYIVAAAMIIAVAVSCNVAAPCSWYDHVPQSSTPNRCAK